MHTGANLAGSPQMRVDKAAETVPHSAITKTIIFQPLVRQTKQDFAVEAACAPRLPGIPTLV
jgi:hypothetical protein